MFDSIIALALRQRALVLLLTLALIAGGVLAFSRLPIDAVPDITNNQVQVLTSAPTLSALEAERFVTFPIEIALKSLPGVTELRSLSQPGLSIVTIVFEDDIDIYFARQQVLEKLREAEDDLPEGAERPELAPVSTGLGEIFRYVVRDTTGRLSPMDLRTVQDWIVRRHLLGTPGLAEVNSLGGYVKQYHVVAHSDALTAYGLTMRDVFDAVARTSGNAGGSYIETGPEHYAVRSVGMATSIDDIRGTVIRATGHGTPITVGDVASVEIGPAIRFGSASREGTGEVVTGITMQLKGANARVTIDAVKERIEQIRHSLPPGVVIEPYYDREQLVDRTIATVVRNLGEGALLVIGVLLLLLVNLRAGIVVASVIPLSMMFAGILMALTGQSGNLMSLGALDFGLVVDGSLIIVENCLRLLEARYREGTPIAGPEMRRLIFAGSTEVRKAAQFGEIIIIVVYLPILTLQGIEGKLFGPMALTVAYALLGALVLSLTYVPAMLSLVMPARGRVRHSPVIVFLRRHYRPLLDRVLRLRVVMLAGTVVLVAAAVVAFLRLGGEFIPRLDEGDIAMHLIRLPSVSLTESQKLATRAEQELMRFPEVRTVVTSTGRAEISTDPMGFELADVFIMLNPPEEWPGGRTKDELIEAMAERMATIPGVGVQFLQPIDMRMNELIAGVRGDVAVKIVGEDYAVMMPAAEQVAKIVSGTEGATDVAREQANGQQQLVIRPDRAAIARYGMTVEDINAVIGVALAGRKAAELSEGEKRFDIVVRLDDEARRDVDAVRSIMVATPAGMRIPLESLADVGLEEGAVRIAREDGSRFVTVQANVRGRDVESFVREIQRKIEEGVKLPPGYVVTYGGQFANLQAASRRLSIVVPVALALIFLLLFQTFGSLRLGALVFLCVPMAVVGGVAALWIGGLAFSISAGVGFIALFGVAVLNGIVMVAAIRKHQAAGMTRREAVLAGADERLRPVITTAALAAIGFLPMLISSGAGAEVQRPLATVIIGGLVSSTFLTLVVLPIIYDRFGGTLRGRTPDEPAPGEGAPDDGAPGEGATNEGATNEGATGEGATGEGATNEGAAGDDVAEANKAGTGGERRGQGRGNGGALGMLAVVAAVLAHSSAFAQAPLSLADIRTRAIAASAEIARGQAGMDAEIGARGSALVLPAPEFFATVEESPAPALTGQGVVSFGVAQSFEFPMIYGARARAIDHAIAQAGAERDAARAAVLHRATRAWLEVLAARARLDLADSGVAIAARFAQVAGRRRDAGEAGALEPLQAAVAVANAGRERADMDAKSRTARVALASLIAERPEAMRLADTLSAGPALRPLAELEAALRSASPRLLAAGFAVEAAQGRRNVSGYSNYPSITLEYMTQSVAGEGGFYGGGIRLAVPLWRWFARGPDDAARADVAGRMAERTELERTLIAELHEIYTRCENLERTVRMYDEQLLPLAVEAYRIALRLYAEGETGYLDVLTAQAGLIAARGGYVDALAERERLRIDLEYLTGEELR